RTGWPGWGGGPLRARALPAPPRGIPPCPHPPLPALSASPPHHPCLPPEWLAVVCPVVAPPSRPSGLLRSVLSPGRRSPLLAVVLRCLGIASPALQPLAAPLRLVRIPIALT